MDPRPARPPRLAIAVPCYNEQEVLGLTVTSLLGELDELARRGLASADSYLMLCDDGSADATWRVIAEAHARDPRVKGLRLSANRGQQTALMAAMEAVRGHCDAVVTVDADLQAPLTAVTAMAEAYAKGAEVVLGIHSGRDTDSAPKRLSARAYYRLQRALGVDVAVDHADCRLLSAQALDRLAAFGERALYLRALVRQLGLPTDVVNYSRQPRAAGRSKYGVRRMLALGLDGITSFTARPIRLILMAGLAVMAAAAVTACFPTRLSAELLSIWFWGGLLMVCIGVVGEYVGKIFMEVKRRPRYFVEERLD